MTRHLTCCDSRYLSMSAPAFLLICLWYVIIGFLWLHYKCRSDNPLRWQEWLIEGESNDEQHGNQQYRPRAIDRSLLCRLPDRTSTIYTILIHKIHGSTATKPKLWLISTRRIHNHATAERHRTLFWLYPTNNHCDRNHYSWINHLYIYHRGDNRRLLRNVPPRNISKSRTLIRWTIVIVRKLILTVTYCCGRCYTSSQEARRKVVQTSPNWP